MAVSAVFSVYSFGDVMLMGKNHILPYYKTEHQRPCAKNMKSAFFQYELYIWQYNAKVVNKMLIIFKIRNNVVNWMSG